MKVIRFIFSVPFAIILLVLGIAQGTLYSVRNAYSEENVSDLLACVDWSELEIPSEDGVVSLRAFTNEALTAHKIPPLSHEEFNEIIRDSAADQLVSDFVLELRAWLFDNGEKPVLDEDRISECMAKAVGSILFGSGNTEIRLPSDPSGISLLSTDQESSEPDLNDIIESGIIPPDYAVMLKELAEEHPNMELSEIMDMLEDLNGTDNAEIPDEIHDASDLLPALEAMTMEELREKISQELELQNAAHELIHALDELAPYRIAVSALALIVLTGCVCVFLLIILCINMKGSTLGLLHIGPAAAFDGFVFFVLSQSAALIPKEVFSEYHIPETTFRLLISPLFAAFRSTGFILLGAGFVTLILGFTLGALRKRR